MSNTTNPTHTMNNTIKIRKKQMGMYEPVDFGQVALFQHFSNRDYIAIHPEGLPAFRQVAAIHNYSVEVV